MYLKTKIYTKVTKVFYKAYSFGFFLCEKTLSYYINDIYKYVCIDVQLQQNSVVVQHHLRRANVLLMYIYLFACHFQSINIMYRASLQTTNPIWADVFYSTSAILSCYNAIMDSIVQLYINSRRLLQYKFKSLRYIYKKAQHMRVYKYVHHADHASYDLQILCFYVLLPVISVLWTICCVDLHLSNQES